MATLIFDMTDDFSLVSNTDIAEEKYYCPNNINEEPPTYNKQIKFKQGYRTVTVVDAEGFLRLQLEPVIISY